MAVLSTSTVDALDWFDQQRVHIWYSSASFSCSALFCYCFFSFFLLLLTSSGGLQQVDLLKDKLSWRFKFLLKFRSGAVVTSGHHPSFDIVILELRGFGIY